MAIVAGPEEHGLVSGIERRSASERAHREVARRAAQHLAGRIVLLVTGLTRLGARDDASSTVT
jgi:hypothetical protein